MKSNLEILFERLSSATYCDEYSGDMDSPTGYFALVEIPQYPEQIDQLMGEVMDDEWLNGQFTAPDPGWYIVITNSQGFTGWDLAESEAVARMDYRALEDNYARWGEDDPDSDVDTEGMHRWQWHPTAGLYCTACAMRPKTIEDMEKGCPVD